MWCTAFSLQWFSVYGRIVMKKILSFPRFSVCILLVFTTVFSTSFPGSAIAVSAAQQALSPSLTIQAPASVELGDRIEIQLIVQNARDLAGYEGQLLFDTSAAHFSGLHQRDSD